MTIHQNHQKHYNSKKFHKEQNILFNSLLFFTNLSQGKCLYYSKFFILIKNQNTAHTHTEMSSRVKHFYHRPTMVGNI